MLHKITNTTSIEPALGAIGYDVQKERFLLVGDSLISLWGVRLIAKATDVYGPAPRPIIVIRYFLWAGVQYDQEFVHFDVELERDQAFLELLNSFLESANTKTL